jgi:hypothetical protein
MAIKDPYINLPVGLKGKVLFADNSDQYVSSAITGE